MIIKPLFNFNSFSKILIDSLFSGIGYGSIYFHVIKNI